MTNKTHVIEMPVATFPCVRTMKIMVEPLEHFECPECESTFDLAPTDEIDYKEDFVTDCPECDCELEIHPIECDAPPLSIGLAEDVAAFLEGYDNKTAVLNSAVRLLKNAVEQTDNE